MLAGVGASMLLAALLALFNLRFRAHIFIAGIAVTFLAYGLTALLLKGVFGQDGVFTSAAHSRPFRPSASRSSRTSPVLGPIVSGHTLLVYVAYLLRAGRLLDALPDALGPARAHDRRGPRTRALAAGVNVERVKFQTMLLSRPVLRPRGRLSVARPMSRCSPSR